MNTPLFTIGQQVFWAATSNVTKWIECHDCFGKKYLKVTLADEAETVLTIPCEGCKRGYEWPSGQIETYEVVVDVKSAMISGLEINSEGVEYKSTAGINSFWCIKEEDLFASEDKAKIRAQVLATERTEAEAKRQSSKTNPKKSWAWHVTYHRNCLKRAQRDAEYHASQLDHAKELAKGGVA